MAGAETAGGRPAGRLGKVLTLPPEDVGRLVEAVAVVLVARAAVRLFRMEQLVLATRRVALASAPGPAGMGGGPESGSEASVASLSWAVDAASNAFGMTCLPRSLGLSWLLARRGLSADLCLGAPRGGLRLPWHAWVELDGRPIGAGARAPGDAGETPFELVCRLPLEPSASPGPPDRA